MYSVKPGRGPSVMGVLGGILAAVGGVIWIIVAVSIGAPPIFAVFGVIFIIAAIATAGYNLINATGRNRMSSMDITTDKEESDPIADALGHTRPPEARDELAAGMGPRKVAGDFCPYCGAKVEPDFDYCPSCGKDI